MEEYIKQILKKSKGVLRAVKKDDILIKDVDLTLKPIPPYSKANNNESNRVLVLGQDPTVKNAKARGDITTTLNLDNNSQLRSYLEQITAVLGVDLDSEVYATNLFKCFFKDPPAKDERILSRHFKYWIDLLCEEISVMQPQYILTLGQPLLKQISFTKNRNVKYYWDYQGKTTSGLDFKFVPYDKNFLHYRIYPLPHQPSWNQNRFYKKYLSDYLNYINYSEVKG